jgi:hypothetical protein
MMLGKYSRLVPSSLTAAFTTKRSPSFNIGETGLQEPIYTKRCAPMIANSSIPMAMGGVPMPVEMAKNCAAGALISMLKYSR